MDNSVAGSIPPEYSKLPLEYLDLGKNNLVGTIPSELFSPSSNSVLEVLWLFDNQLSGTLPSIMQHFSGRELWLEGNMFTGTIPSELFGASSLEKLYLGSSGGVSQL